MVTGKNKEKFEEWYVDNIKYKVKEALCENAFKTLCFEMQIGVYLAYYDSINMFMNIEHNELSRKYMYSFYFKPMQNDMYSMAIFNSRNEAYKEAFKKANDLINNNLDK